MFSYLNLRKLSRYIQGTMFDNKAFIKSINNKIECKYVTDKIRGFVRKLCSVVHGVVFDNKAFIITFITRWNVNVSDKVRRSVT
jgi:hypothetical protein